VIDAQRLWIGGLMAGVVAAGVAIVGLLIVRGVFDIKVFVTGDGGKVVNASTWWYAVVSFVSALFATGLLHLLLISAPIPWRFFGCIIGLPVAIAVIIPFTSDAELSANVGTAGINLAIGIAVFSIVSGVGHAAASARTFLGLGGRGVQERDDRIALCPQHLDQGGRRDHGRVLARRA
jgi:hypothetical protein